MERISGYPTLILGQIPDIRKNPDTEFDIWWNNEISALDIRLAGISSKNKLLGLF